MDDYREASSLRPGASLFVVNRTAGLLRADFVVVKDMPGVRQWRAMQEDTFGTGHFTLHSPRLPAGRPEVDYWWPAANGSGTTAWCTAKIACFMGFSEIILCGVPIAPGPHADGEDGETWSGGSGQIDKLRRAIEADTDWHGRVSSMSGWTRDFLGAPCPM